MNHLGNQGHQEKTISRNKNRGRRRNLSQRQGNIFNKMIKESFPKPGLVAHAFNPSTREAEAGGFLSSRPAWSTE
jgi:major histocompatibility complex class I